jgi:hypothetical protein
LAILSSDILADTHFLDLKASLLPQEAVERAAGVLVRAHHLTAIVDPGGQSFHGTSDLDPDESAVVQ